MDKVVIIHFAPLELYPPVQNLLLTLAARNDQKKIIVLTTSLTDVDLSNFVVNNDRFTIIRLGKSGQTMPAFRRYLNYLYFHTVSIIALLIKKPTRILYFETLSSFPAYFYKRYINRKADIHIHYHEYVTPGEYATGMTLAKQFHQDEKWLYPLASWVSHTNSFRMDKFLADIQPTVVLHPFVLPNYPPEKWYNRPARSVRSPLQIVYAGALSLATMYTREFANWVVARQGQVQWDIYSYNCDDDARDYLLGLNTPWIVLHKGVQYRELPAILCKYDVGVVLYNGHIPNYIYNAPNKLFEYLASGLDVWFPSIMEGSLPYCQDKYYPKVLPLDFTRLEFFAYEKAVDRLNCDAWKSPYYCENALEGIIDKLTAI